MKMIKNFAKKVVVKYGNVISGLAFTFVILTANSSCVMPFYELEEPIGLDKYKKFSN